MHGTALRRLPVDLRDIIRDQGGFSIEAWLSYLERHPEIHCPVCGRKELHAYWRPVVLPYRTPPKFDDPFVCCAVVCEHCAHVMLISADELDGELVIGHLGEVNWRYKRRRNSPLRYSDLYRSDPGGPRLPPEQDPLG